MLVPRQRLDPGISTPFGSKAQHERRVVSIVGAHRPRAGCAGSCWERRLRSAAVEDRLHMIWQSIFNHSGCCGTSPTRTTTSWRDLWFFCNPQDAREGPRVEARHLRARLDAEAATWRCVDCCCFFRASSVARPFGENDQPQADQGRPRRCGSSKKAQPFNFRCWFVQYSSWPSICPLLRPRPPVFWLSTCAWLW